MSGPAHHTHRVTASLFVREAWPSAELRPALHVLDSGQSPPCHTDIFVNGLNHRRVHGKTTDHPGYTTRAALEADYYRSLTVPTNPVTTQTQVGSPRPLGRDPALV